MTIIGAQKGHVMAKCEVIFCPFGCDSKYTFNILSPAFSIIFRTSQFKPKTRGIISVRTTQNVRITYVKSLLA
jgi:hypothetical protein